MSAIYFILPIALFLGIFFVIGYIWAVKKGQYDDLTTPAMRMLFDDKNINQKINKTEKGKDK
jgi:cbb3-type cytochrome oxidase maturation protein